MDIINNQRTWLVTEYRPPLGDSDRPSRLKIIIVKILNCCTA